MRTRTIVSTSLLLGAALVSGPPSDAATGCSVTVGSTDGSVKVSANATSSSLRWGTAVGAENTTFANAATCISAGHANNCLLGTSGTLAARTPPATCMLYLNDGAAACSVLVPGCVPGVRLRDGSFASNDPRAEAVSLEDGGATLRFSGVNLQVVSGTGATEGTINGRGNLIVGYNEVVTGNEHSGSHNVVVGDQHTYSSYGGIVAGQHNDVTAPFASVTGGYDNTASGSWSAVTGGQMNVASGTAAAASGGFNNQSTYIFSSISGGGYNVASGLYASISGGAAGTTSAPYASISGGISNAASALGASVAGGEGNTASGTYASVAGGEDNTASGEGAAVGGGDDVVAGAGEEWVAGCLDTAAVCGP